MTESKFEMYAILAKFRAGKNQGKYPEGEKHAILAYAKATSHVHAEAIVINQLSGQDWFYPEIEKIAIIDVESNIGVESVNTANEEGFAAVIYGSPED